MSNNNAVASKRKPLFPLISQQAKAVIPDDNIWLSASAGTGKTQVLTARVIRLLLEDNVKPENLLCITFTKAGATEMSERINQLLASWVQLDEHDLFHDLEAIGARSDIEARNRARRLFASVLDAPGGGLQIMTIHSLCQSLLASFPEEAGLVPGFEPVEGREQAELFREALDEMIIAAENGKDEQIIASLQQLSLSLGEKAAQEFLQKCAAQPDAMASVPDDKGAIIYARRIVGVEFEGTVQDYLESALSDTVLDRASIDHIAQMNSAWGGKRGLDRAAAINEWLALDIAERAEKFSTLHGFWSKADGEPMVKSKGYTPPDDAYASIALELYQWTSKLLANITLAEYAERLAPALLAGKAYSLRYQTAKQLRGLVDFNDMISKTAELLNGSGMSEWVRYKLDRQIDHILIDEAQDTNAAQWKIVKALSDDFFSGAGAKGEQRERTIFSVGDYKQAIFGFQGTDPEQYRQAGNEFEYRIQNAGKALQRLDLSQSFRSNVPVLDFVNAVIDYSGPEKFGLNEEIAAHFSKKHNAGSVELLQPVSAVDHDAASDDEESWIDDEKRELARRIASYITDLVHEAPILTSTQKPLVPGDIMILLRSRGELASYLVGQLHDRGVPVAGIDRLRLQQPLAVQDMLSVIRFVLQPSDDLSLACILVSPLIGWSQDDLLKYGYRSAEHHKKSLWHFLRNNPEITGDIEILAQLLAQADYGTVYDFLENILSGPIRGREKFHARLGQETLVPIEELLNAALQFEQNGGGGLQAFLAWFERGDTEIKREGIAGSNEVRVMTVHGAKGLQAPVVILADTTSDPEKAPSASELLFADGKRLPVLPIRKSERFGRLDEIVDMQETRDINEHFRLFYVAITRAEERLIMAGALGVSRKGVAPEESWYNLAQNAMHVMGCEWQDDALWGRAMRYKGEDAPEFALQEDKAGQGEICIGNLPDWAMLAAPEESKPPRPLAPSYLDDDDYGDVPAPKAMLLAAEKGRLIHSVFERMSGDDVDRNLERAAAFLQAHDRDNLLDTKDILQKIEAVITEPEWQPFFGNKARAEVPLAAVVGEAVITGRIDRLYIGDDVIRILDFKTGRYIPKEAFDLPRAYIRQMAHYVAALEVIFPGHRIEANLLFTHKPVMMHIPDAVLAAHKPAPIATDKQIA